ncbi:MAG: permease prefix domain 1-containing protein [Gemmatimonadales bacterium]
MRATMRKLSTLFGWRSRLGDDLTAEIRQHLEERADELIARGLSPADARAAARRAFGNPTLVAEVARETWGRRWFDDLIVDLRHGARQLRRTPVVAGVCVLTLGLGIGANAAIFSVVDEVVLQPLPFHDPERLVIVSETRPGNVERTGAPFTRYRERAALRDLFSSSGAYWDVSGGDGMVFGSAGVADRVQFSIATADLFPMLGVRPARGRGFTKAEDVPGNGSRVFLASDVLWRTRLAGETTAIGRT